MYISWRVINVFVGLKHVPEVHDRLFLETWQYAATWKKTFSDLFRAPGMVGKQEKRSGY